MASDRAPFLPIWYVTAGRSTAKIAYPIDLLSAVLDGSLAPATQVRDDGAASWIASGARHEGEWRQGKRHGPGVAVTADGTETAGQWTDDRAAGA